MSWLKAFRDYMEETSRFWVEQEAGRYAYLEDKERQSLNRKKKSLKDRNAVIVKTSLDGQILKHHQYHDQNDVDYLLHLRHLVKQQDDFYIEEQIERRSARFAESKLHVDRKLEQEGVQQGTFQLDWEHENPERKGFAYNRRDAVRYAEKWWNSYNPDYRAFDVDCTNYISQCLHAGGAPMHGYPQRGKGWWFGQNQWSFSWAVAHSLRWYLSGSSTGLRARELSSPEELLPGDVICYDFEGDNHWDHSTIVVAKDTNDMPLVNAHTTNSRMRYWDYEDSTAWTAGIRYKFFRVVDDNK